MKGYVEDDVHLGGKVTEDEQLDFDWREEPDGRDVDDEELEETLADVLAILGFDPKKEEEEDRA